MNKINRKYGGNVSGSILRIAIGIPLLAILLLVNSTGASTGLEAISVNPTQGSAGSVVTIAGTGWYEHASDGMDVPIWIGFANEVGRAYPDANGNFNVSVTIPASASPGQLEISAIIGNGGSADTYFNVTPGSAPSPSPTPTPTLTPTSPTQLPPEIVRVETFREGDLVFLRLFFIDPNNDAEGFGFRGVNGSGWAEETHPFSNPSYGRVSPGQIEYPFNHSCKTGNAIESDVEAWIYDSAGLVSPSVTVHLACQSTVTPTPTPTPTPVTTPPTVSITANPDTHVTTIGTSFTFTANLVGSWSNNIQYSWSIANDKTNPACSGSDWTATGQSISASAACIGTHIISVTASDEKSNVANDTYSVTVNKNAAQFGEVHGTVFNDLNGDGVRDSGELALANWTIKMNFINGSIFRTTTTDNNGYYVFENVPEGSYLEQEILKPNWIVTIPVYPPVPPISTSAHPGGFYTFNISAGQNMTDMDFGNAEVEPIPVILVHGFMKPSNDNAWAETMKTRFTNAGFTVEIFNYDSINQDIKISAGMLAKKIDEVRKKYNNTTKVDIVGHSEGGIVARTYINSHDLYKDDVRKLVMIGSPNHGTDLPFYYPSFPVGIKIIYSTYMGTPLLLDLGKAANQMESHSPFLQSLNDNDNCADLQHGSDRDYLNPSVQYYTIASHTPFAPLELTITHKHFKVFNFDFNRPIFIHDGDSLTADNSLRLTGPTVVNVKAIPNVWHWDQVNSKDIIDRAIFLIRVDTSSSEAYVASNIEQTPDNIAAQWSPPIQGTIKSNEIKSHTVFIDNTIKKAEFNLFWPGSDLDLVLYTPSGAKINSSIALNDPNINYTSEAIFESYEVRFPEPGNWTMEITAVNVTSTGENYSAITFMETNLFVGAGTDKESYIPDEPITLAAYVQDDGTPLSKANVTASISRPDGTNNTIQLYDDGLHNDNQTDDGIYANIYTDTNVSGVYYITTSANGMIRNESFERKAFKNVWVELYPDLTITSSDINFSNDTPMPGENIIINATIHNLGDADANNASILFYDGDPASGVLMAEDKINVSAGQIARASSSWNTTAGQHEIYVLISPFNEFLEKNYTNNKASRIINVKPTPTPTSAPSGLSGGSSGGGGGGGGGGGTSGENYSNIEIKEKYDLYIYKDKATSYTFTDSRNPIVFINITGNVSAGEITTTVEVLRNTSSLVTDPAPGIVHKNVNVWVGTSTFAVPKNMNKAVIRFRVENSWISGNNIKSSSIRIARWDKDMKKWDMLVTSEITKDSRYTYFDAQTNALSPLAITALKEASSTAMPSYTAAQSGIAPTGTSTTDVNTSEPSQGGGLMNLSIILVVFAMVGIVIAFYLKKKGNFKK